MLCRVKSKGECCVSRQSYGDNEHGLHGKGHKNLPVVLVACR